MSAAPEPAGTLAELVCGSGFVLETERGAVTGPELAGAARRYAAGFARYPRGAGVSIGLTDPAEALAVAAGAWWSGLRVAFTRTDSPHDPAAQARIVDALVQVVDAGTEAAGGVTRLTPGELLGPPVDGAPRCRPSDPALDLLTSGSTGTPKCVVFGHAAMVANARSLAAAMRIGRTDLLWTSLPHGLPGVLSTVTLPAAAADATALLVTPADPLVAADSLVAAAPSVVYAVPEFYDVLGRISPAAGSAPSVRWWLSSSSQLSAGRFDRMRERWGAVVRSFYCGSEVGTVTFNDDDDPDSVRSGVGRPLPGVRVLVERDGSGSGVAGVPDAGRLTIGGDLVALGYRERGVLVPFPSDGVRTSDLGYLDDDGALRLVGRVDDRIHVGAEVVDPQMVEACINAHPAVHDCVVVPKPHTMLGSVLEARVVRRAGTALSERDVILACRAHGLRNGWLPRAVRWIDTVPTTPAGKPNRDPGWPAG
ncbi:class I adenylate-forming enzyme family protein [Plantactinospora sp. BB1]|uniref:class I adenylate-forming enzyme family protein n=1 Tax=Plantactinospora sp. BB1 TaxID=2071627 RepID=UPI000D15F360|nr:fatty acid--CoA ligase family protein [Plantactinospora sp. BB1]AVT40938.1 hypothetical protein C6W10_35885 [Plantactinospora sp. BB1]